MAYFDQLHAQLDDAKSVRDNVRDGADTIEINGVRRHIIGYLEDFLFTPEQAAGPVSRLSGGERNRLLLARLLTKPSNVLVMDEPTNDLDIETLELLEQLLVEYPGTLLLVSHDREFLNNVVTSTLVLEGDGRVKEYAGGYDDWLRQRPAEPAPRRPEPVKEKTKPAAPPKQRPRRLTYAEQRELEALPEPDRGSRSPDRRAAHRDGRPGVLSPRIRAKSSRRTLACNRWRRNWPKRIGDGRRWRLGKGIDKQRLSSVGRQRAHNSRGPTARGMCSELLRGPLAPGDFLR